jgi:hypothetical protein
LSALVRFRFFALEDSIDPGDGAAGPVFQFRADLIVSGSPSERFEHLGRRRFGLDDPHQHESTSGPTISMISAAVAGRETWLIKLFFR